MPEGCYDTCPTCGGRMIGDGYTSVRVCENVPDVPLNIEADAGPLYCCNRYDPEEDPIVGCGCCVQMSTKEACLACRKE